MGRSRLLRNLQHFGRRCLYQSSVPSSKPRLDGRFRGYVTIPLERKSQISPLRLRAALQDRQMSTMNTSFDQFDTQRSIIASGRIRACYYEQRCSYTSGQNLEGKESYVNLGDKLATRVWSEDQQEESDSKIWTDGQHHPAENLPDQISDLGAVLDGADSRTAEVASQSIWTILRVPADAVVALVDGVHSLTGTPWWLTIIGSTLAFRVALFPFTLTYVKKSAQFAASLSLLPPIRPPKDSNKSFAEQFRIFTKKRLELGVPSPFWATAGLLQAPLFLYWIIALRGMAMNKHPGFDSGGTLWFVDLTVPVHGALGALFPSVMALTYFINIQVSFRKIKPRNDITGFVMKGTRQIILTGSQAILSFIGFLPGPLIYQWWMEALAIPLFIMGFYLPQGVFMYWLTNNCCNLAQSLALQHDGFRGRFGLPLLSELEKLRAKQELQSKDADIVDPEMLDADALILSASKHVTEDREEEAIKLLKFAVKKYPDEAEAYNVFGMLHIKKKQWSEAMEYYSLAIMKANNDSPRITAFMGAGISLFNQGMKQEAIDIMKPLLDIKVPQELGTRQKYLRALVTLSSLLSQEGFKEEALSVLKRAVKWDSSIQVYIKELQQQINS